MKIKFHNIKDCEMCKQLKFELEMQTRQTDKFKIAYWKEKREREKAENFANSLIKPISEPDEPSLQV